MTLPVGSRLGPYEILARLGAGGMGEVYRVRDTRLHRELAIKVLPASVAKDADFLARFQSEARAASALNHPNIITIHDIGSADGVSYILMELVDGKTVRELLDGGPPPLKKTLQIAAQVAEGLAAAHARGIVHRDLKPENLMVSRDGVVKILDFGLAKTTPLYARAGEETGSYEAGRDAARERARHGRIHVSRAGLGAIAGLSVRPVLPRHDPLRDAHGQARLEEKHGGRDADGDHPGGPRAADRGRGPGHADGSALDREPLPRQGAGGALRLHAGSRPRSRDGQGSLERDQRRRPGRKLR